MAGAEFAGSTLALGHGDYQPELPTFWARSELVVMRQVSLLAAAGFVVGQGERWLPTPGVVGSSVVCFVVSQSVT
jgi:hypothetical protein